MRPSRIPALAWVILGAGGMTTLGALPVFLLGSQSVLIRADLGFDERRFGVLVGTFFGAAALSALLGGRLADRLGRRNCTIFAGLGAAVGGFGVAWAGHSWAAMLVFMVWLGVVNAACQVTSNVSMAHALPAHRRGLGFGIKQSSIPFAIIIAGLAVPVLGADAGWRATFVVFGCCGLVAASFGRRIPRLGGRSVRQAVSRERPPRIALITAMFAVTCASAAANSLGAFIASWAHQAGLTTTQAGLLMAVGSALNIIARISGGLLADRRAAWDLPVVGAQMFIGGCALAVLSVPSPLAIVAGGLVAFALGWSWPGLLLYAVVRVGRDFPGAASGMIQGGAFAGGAIGPALFGVVAATAGFETAWRLAGLLLLVAAMLIALARWLFIVDMNARPLRPHAPQERM